jgi:excisionase family DNA binding protein
VTLPTLLTAAEVATYLRVSKVTVYREITRGRLQSVHIGTQLRVTEEALLSYITLCTAQPAHASPPASALRGSTRRGAVPRASRRAPPY